MQPGAPVKWQTSKQDRRGLAIFLSLLLNITFAEALAETLTKLFVVEVKWSWNGLAVTGVHQLIFLSKYTLGLLFSFEITQ